MEERLDQLVNLAMLYGLQVIGAILILIAGRFAAGILRGVVRRIMVKANADESLTKFVSKLLYYLIIAFAFVAALSKFGIETASLVAVLGAAGFAAGFAMQGSLSNFASGVMILAFRPFKIGDYIDGAGVAGTVKEIQLFNTILATPDNVKILVPNSKMYGDIIKNFSAYDTRRVDLVVGIGYAASIGAAIDTAKGLIGADSRIMKDPAPQLVVGELADSSVNIIIRVWVQSPDYWAVKFDMTRSIKEAFDQKNIEIPFPQRVVHMVTQTA